jgi:hypothetical protein
VFLVCTSHEGCVLIFTTRIAMICTALTVQSRTSIHRPSEIDIQIYEKSPDVSALESPCSKKCATLGGHSKNQEAITAAPKASVLGILLSVDESAPEFAAPTVEAGVASAVLEVPAPLAADEETGCEGGILVAPGGCATERVGRLTELLVAEPDAEVVVTVTTATGLLLEVGGAGGALVVVGGGGGGGAAVVVGGGGGGVLVVAGGGGGVLVV